jgi:pimeloyl-[acyl-carrier protein] methyl ester esterase
MTPVLVPPVSVLSAVLLGQQSSAKWRDEFAAVIRALDVKVAKARVLQALAVDARAELSTIQSKILFLHASRDRLLRKHSFAEMDAANHTMESVMIDGPHFLLQTRADLCARAIRQHFV